MTNNDYMNLVTHWVRTDRDPAFAAQPFINELPPVGAAPALRCCFSDNTPDQLQLWFVLGEVDSDGVDHLVDLLEANDEMDEQVEGLGYFACLHEATRDRFAWLARMPFTPSTSVNDLRNAVARGQAHASARWLAAVPR